MSTLEFAIAIYKRLATITDNTSKDQRYAIEHAQELLDVIEKEGRAIWQDENQ